MKLLLLCLFLTGCIEPCYPGACYDAVVDAAGEGAMVRKAQGGGDWWVRKKNGEVFKYKTQAPFDCRVTGKERIL